MRVDLGHIQCLGGGCGGEHLVAAFFQNMNTDFEDCSFIKCDLSLAILNNCIFQNTHFEDCQIVGVNWMDTNLNIEKFQFAKTIGFDKCTINHCTFLGLNLKNIQLTHCTAHDVSFEEADLSGADCRWTDFGESRFLHTNLTGSDFTSTVQYQISVGDNIIKKARFSLPEAMNLLNGLDIILVDDNNLDR